MVLQGNPQLVPDDAQKSPYRPFFWPIKFKARCRETGEMYLAGKYGEVMVKGDGRLFQWKDVDESAILIELDPNEWDIYLNTGKKDVLGKPIYEADILEGPKGEIGVVVWDAQVACFILATTDGTEWDDGWMLMGEWAIIGTAYDNPELLKEVYTA